jgi:hypothetical protein
MCEPDAYPTKCPQPVEADVLAPKGNSGFDPEPTFRHAIGCERNDTLLPSRGIVLAMPGFAGARSK